MEALRTFSRSASTCARTAKAASRPSQTISASHLTNPSCRMRIAPLSTTLSAPPIRSYRVSFPQQKGLSPDSADPKAPNTESHDLSAGKQEAADLSDAEYHELSDQYMNTLQLTLEELADREAQRGLEVEYAAGVLTVTHPDKGTYVLNKQPPNKQIWLSSPVSGPKRFDWVLRSTGGMSSKQDTEGSEGDVGDDGHVGGGKWIYIRDGAGLSEILREELEVVLKFEGEGSGDVAAASGTRTPTGESQAVEG